MTLEEAITLIALSALIGYCIPPIAGALMIWIANMRDKHTIGKEKE